MELGGPCRALWSRQFRNRDHLQTMLIGSLNKSHHQPRGWTYDSKKGFRRSYQLSSSSFHRFLTINPSFHLASALSKLYRKREIVFGSAPALPVTLPRTTTQHRIYASYYRLVRSLSTNLVTSTSGSFMPPRSILPEFAIIARTKDAT